MLSPTTTKDAFGRHAPTLSRWFAGVGRELGRVSAWVFKEENSIRAGLIFFGCMVAAHLLAGMLVCPWPNLAVKTSSPNPWGGAPLLKWRHILSQREALLIDFGQWSLVTMLFARVARRVWMIFLVPLSLAAIAIVALLVFVVVEKIAGMAFYWDLWH